MTSRRYRRRDESTAPLREYRGLIWIGDQPGRRVRIMASSGEEAEKLLVQEYGVGHVYTLWNEEDARRPR